jgi:ankyrin repeat protein
LLAASKGNLKEVQLLVEKEKADVNTCDREHKNTALHLAAKFGNGNLAELLARKLGADVNVFNKDGMTPLHIACQLRNQNVVERLLLAGANANL